MKVVLPYFITNNQCVFLKSMSAMDNAMIRLELVSQIKAKKSRDISIKLDLTKAFDHVEWSLITCVVEDEISCLNYQPSLQLHIIHIDFYSFESATNSLF